MAEKVVIKAQPRQLIGKQVKSLRRSGGLPAIIYGKRVDPLPITLDYREASRILSGITLSQLIIIDVDGGQHTVLLRDRQRNPVRGDLLHVDFLEVSLTETLRTEVPIVLEGTAPAVEKQIGFLATNVESLSVEALPDDLPERITVDVSSLQDIGDAIYVKDLALPPQVSVLQDLEEVVVIVTAPVAELEEEEVEEEEALEAEEDMEPEVIERGKKEEEEES